MFSVYLELRSRQITRVQLSVSRWTQLRYSGAPRVVLARRSFHSHRPCLAEENRRKSFAQMKPLQQLRNLKLPETVRENIYTLPNLLTVSRILACPVLGYCIVQDNFVAATSLLVYAGLTDLVCVSRLPCSECNTVSERLYDMRSVLGTILDPAADKTLMTTLTVTLAMKSLIPLPLAAIIIGRDVLLSLSAFYIRYTSLPEPKTFARYWDFSIPSAEVRPTTVSKFNTALQLLLMGTTTISPLLPLDIGLGLQALQWTVGVTTVWSGASYLFSKDAVRILSKQARNQNPPNPPA
ncbi:hypothetical protein NM688_g3756 [Phlebia brevispora]|uniref:Uncharacterized protein n=1 Tax=Phlebia brevispora TaxID=194682 RepID=A0ACC1T4T1_9APHY|nr:hypothetical protein NM688_g3756 [Phlebia brevispora]